jgi:hypothetical protein
MRFKHSDLEVTFSGMTSLLNLMKICQFVKKLLVGDTETDRQIGYLISLPFIFKGSRII